MTERSPAPLRSAVDGTMSLLTDLAEDAVHSDYGEPGERPPETGEQRRNWLPWTLGSVALAGTILAVALVQARDAAPVVEARRGALVERVQAAEEANAALDARVRDLRAAVASAEARAVADSEEGQQLAARATDLAAAAQYTTVTGPGATVVVDDAEDLKATGVDLGRVLDRDLQLVVNGLWRAGATSIAINDRRLSARTAIRSAGGAILVDYRPLSPPYRIAALGPDSMAADFENGPAGKDLRGLSEDYGVRWSVEPSPELTLPPADSALPQLATVSGGQP